MKLPQGKTPGAVGCHPGDDARDQHDDAHCQDALSEHVPPVPAHPVQHLVAVAVPHRLCQGAAGTDPAAVRAFPPEVDDRRQDDEGLHETDHEPRREGLVSKDVPDEQWPGQDEAESAPVLTAVVVRHLREKSVGEALANSGVEAAVVAHPRQNDIRQQEQRYELEGGQARRLPFHVLGTASAHPPDSEDDDERAVDETVVETRLAEVVGKQSPHTRGAGGGAGGGQVAASGGVPSEVCILLVFYSVFIMFLVFLLKCILFLKSAENRKVSISLQPWRILENSKHNPAMIFDDLYENVNKILHKNMTFKKIF